MDATRRLALLVLAVIPGFGAVVACAFYLNRDWPALERAFRHLQDAAQSGDLRAIAAAEAYDLALRLNCFAEGVGVLLGAILAAIGVHGLCTLPTALSPTKRSTTAGSPTVGSPASSSSLNGEEVC